METGREGDFRFCGKADSGAHRSGFPLTVSISRGAAVSPAAPVGSPTGGSVPPGVGAGEEKGEQQLPLGTSTPRATQGGAGGILGQAGAEQQIRTSGVLGPGSPSALTLPGVDVPREERGGLLGLPTPRGSSETGKRPGSA